MSSRVAVAPPGSRLPLAGAWREGPRAASQGWDCLQEARAFALGFGSVKFPRQRGKAAAAEAGYAPEC